MASKANNSGRPPSSRPRFIVIGNPDNRRIHLFQAALARLRLEPATVFSYVDLLTGRVSLRGAIETPAIVRIESPGEDFEVERRLLAAGADIARAEGTSYLPRSRIDGLAFDRGLLLNSRQWYLGFERLLERIDRELADRETVTKMNQPADVAIMFDKCRCHSLCRQAGIPTPESFEPIQSYDELVCHMEKSGRRRVFVKLAHGSSASGVVALYRNGKRQRAVTTAELVCNDGEVRLYNSLRPRCYTEPNDIRSVIDTLCQQRVHVEEWLPKASLGRATFDLRVVVIGGVARHVVVRQSRGPMTNLHLGNRRGDVVELQRRMGARRWSKMLETCERTMELFPGALYAGVDVCLSPGFRTHSVLEVNAFGDLLPGVLWNGKDTYTAEVETALDRRGAAGR